MQHAMIARNVFIVVFLGLQLVLPLRYYLANSDPDERFCWRMFSTRQHELESADYDLVVSERQARNAKETDRPIELSTELSAPWIRFLEFGFPRVIQRFLQSRNEVADGGVVVLRLEGSTHDEPLEFVYPQSSAAEASR